MVGQGAAAESGLLEISPRSRVWRNIPLRMFIFHRPQPDIDPRHSPVSPARCAERSPPGTTTVRPPEMTTLTDQMVPEMEGAESTCQDLLQPGKSMSGKGRHRRTGLSAKPNRIPSHDSPAKRPPRANGSRPEKSHGQALSGTLATNIALALLGAATGVIAARILGPEGEGEIAAIQTWPLLLGTLSMLGLDSAVVYFGAREPDKGKQFTTTATVIGLLSAMVVGGAAWFALPLLLAAQRAQIVSAARMFLLVGVIFALVGIPHGSLRGAHSFTAWNLFRIAPGLAWLSILLSSWAFGNPNAIPISEWYLGSILVCGLPFLIVVNRKLRGILRPDFRLAPDLLRFGIPSALASLPQTINLRFDQILIIAFLPARSLGFYIVAVAWSGGVAPVLSAIGSVLFPHVSAETDTERRGYLLARALQGGTLVAIATSLPFMLLAPVGLPLVFGARFAPSIPSALLLVPAGAILAWAGVAEEGLRGLGHPTIVLTAEAAAAGVTVGTLPLLLHTYGIFGAAIASFLGYLTVAIVAVIAISRSTHHPVLFLVIPRWAFIKSLVTRSFSPLSVLRHKGVRVG
jgi:O-antigen/teichoic acid export membrane protein